MLVDLILPHTRRTEVALNALEDSLDRDDPKRRNKTHYNYPKQEYTASLLKSLRRACRSILLHSRLIEFHVSEESAESDLLLVDCETMVIEQTLWQRQLSEALVKLVLIEAEGDDDHFRAALLKDKAKGRKNLRNELGNLFGAEVRLLEVYCDNDIKAYESIKQKLGSLPIEKSFEVAIRDAFPILSDLERFSVGHYFHFRWRSGGIHGSTFPDTDQWQEHSSVLMHHLLTTSLLCSCLCLRLARLYPIVLPEVVALREPEIEAIFEDSFKRGFAPEIEVGDSVSVRHDNQDYRGTVKEIRHGKYGGLSFKVERMPGEPKWCSDADFHPAMFVRKCDRVDL